MAEIVPTLPAKAHQPNRDLFTYSLQMKTPSAPDSAIRTFLIRPKKDLVLSTEEEYDHLEYLTKALMVMRSTGIKDSLALVSGKRRSRLQAHALFSHMAPNGQHLLTMLEKKGKPISGSMKPGDLSINQWYDLLRVFLEWPFRPTVRIYLP